MNPHSYMARLRQIPAACSKVTERGRATHPRGFDPHAPASVSGLVVYLASDASSWLTGQVFRVPRHWPGSFLVSVLSSWLLRGCSRARTQRSYGARIHEIGCDLLLSEIASGGQRPGWQQYEGLVRTWLKVDKERARCRRRTRGDVECRLRWCSGAPEGENGPGPARLKTSGSSAGTRPSSRPFSSQVCTG